MIMTPVNTLLRTLLLCGLIATSGCSGLSSVLFYPHNEHVQTPESLNVSYETILLNSDEFTLHNWLIKPPENIQTKARILFLHGNGENISTHINSVAWLTQSGFEVFLLDYRGYGKSEGSSTLGSAMRDIYAAHKWLSTQNNLPIVLYGQSMGGALGITYAANYENPVHELETENLSPFSAIISESAPASWPQVAREAMRKHWITWIVQVPASLIESGYDPEQYIGSLKPPVMLMHSKKDSIVNFRHFEQLLAEAKRSNIDVTSYQTNGNHTQGLAFAQARKRFVEFVEEHIQLDTGNTGGTSSTGKGLNQANHASPES